jgi:hypothetical protein
MSCAASRLASGHGSWGMASKMPRVHSPKNWRKPSTSAVTARAPRDQSCRHLTSRSQVPRHDGGISGARIKNLRDRLGIILTQPLKPPEDLGHGAVTRYVFLCHGGHMLFARVASLFAVLFGREPSAPPRRLVHWPPPFACTELGPSKAPLVFRAVSAHAAVLGLRVLVVARLARCPTVEVLDPRGEG